MLRSASPDYETRKIAQEHAEYTIASVEEGLDHQSDTKIERMLHFSLQCSYIFPLPAPARQNLGEGGGEGGGGDMGEEVMFLRDSWSTFCSICIKKNVHCIFLKYVAVIFQKHYASPKSPSPSPYPLLGRYPRAPPFSYHPPS